MEDLRNKTIRAGIANVFGRAVSVLLRVVSIMVLGRLLSPSDYGLVGMVTAFTGVLNLFIGFGLFQVAIQRDTMTEERASTLFWVNIVLGGLLTATALALAPALSAFYHEPRLTLVTSFVAIGFVLAGAGIQHGALLQRQMRFGVSALIDICSWLIGTSIAIGMALAGSGYWALVSVTVSIPLTTTIGVWLAAGWVPGRPRKGTGIRSMMWFGGTMTLNGLVAYVAMNIDKMLLGRFWGAEALGIYGRAYNLVTFPIENLNSTIGEVAFAALSRTKNEPERLRRYFIKGYSLVVALTLPMTMIGALFADDLIAVVLGPKWGAAAEIFRILSPTIFVFAIAAPLGWLLNSVGLVERGLKIALVSAPLVILGVVIGLPYGPRGVAIAYSTVTLLRVIPITAWAVHGTPVRISDILTALWPPIASSLVAAALASGVHHIYGPMLSLFPRLFVDVAMFGIAYIGMLLLLTDHKTLYMDLLRATKMAPSC